MFKYTYLSIALISGFILPSSSFAQRAPNQTEIDHAACVYQLPKEEKNVNILNSILTSCMSNKGYSFGAPTSQSNAAASSSFPKQKSEIKEKDFLQDRGNILKQCYASSKTNEELVACIQNNNQAY